MARTESARRPLAELVTFLNDAMSMSEVYQPAVILHLLERDGVSSKQDLAATLAGHDRAVLEYYEKVLMRWPKATLSRHGIIECDAVAKVFKLRFDLGDPTQLATAKRVCEERIREWIESRAQGDSTASVRASIRYRVLKAARGRCELCGISSKLSPIDVDHIVPRSRSDKRGFISRDGVRMPLDDERNLQALCFRCNRAKRDSDDTDFRTTNYRIVRDDVGTMIAAETGDGVWRLLEGATTKKALIEKLIDDHVALIDANDRAAQIDAVVDMIEVLMALGRELGCDEAEVLARRLDRQRAARPLRGGPNPTDVLNSRRRRPAD